MKLQNNRNVSFKSVTFEEDALFTADYWFKKDLADLEALEQIEAASKRALE